MGNDYFPYVIGVLYAMGLGLLGYGWWCARQSTRAAHWPTAPATFKILEVYENSDSDGTTYGVQVLYTYTVDGVVFESSRLAFGYGGSSQREAQELCRKLKETKTVEVRYDPADPSVSCLLFGLHSSIRFLLAVAITWLLYLTGFTLLFWSRFRPPPAH